MGMKVGIVTSFLLCAAAANGFSHYRRLICPEGIKSFSFGNSTTHYFKCGPDKTPVLTECPPGMAYKMKKSKCVRADEEEVYKPIDMKAMGRKWVSLGALYDATKNEFDRSSSLWDLGDGGTVEKNKYRYTRKEVITDFRADSSTVEKSNHFEIGADLTLSFMSGQIDVSGAMSYLSDQKESEKQMKVEMLYHTTKYTETLPKYTPIDYLSDCDIGFTHAVTSVTLGMDANFIFTYTLSESESQEDIMGSLAISVNSIPSFNVSGSGDVSLSDHDREVTERTAVELFGDLSLVGSDVQTPTTFQEACEFYEKLPSLLGSEEEWWPKAAILEVHLTPLTDICTETDMVLKDISEGMLNQVVNLLDDIETLLVKVGGLLQSEPADRYAPLRTNLNLYMNGLLDYQGDVQRDLRDILPDIRGGMGGEDDLCAFITANMESPWYFVTSEEFLIDRGREISSITFLQNTLRRAQYAKNIKVADFDNANDIQIALEYEHVLEVELKILSTKSVTEDFLDGNTQDESGFWYNDITVNGNVGYLIRKFEEFAMENVNGTKFGYLVRLTEIEEGVDPVNVITHDNENHDHETPPFVVPTSPAGPAVYDISHDSVKFSIEKQNINCTGVKVIVYDAVTDQNKSDSVHDFPEELNFGEQHEFEINGLQPATVYYFLVKYNTHVGLSPPSTKNQRFITAPSSPPIELTKTEISTSSVKVSWSRPDVIGDGISESELQYSATIRGVDTFEATIVTGSDDREVTFEGLNDATEFVVTVISFLPYHDVDLPPNINYTSIIYVSVSQEATLTNVFSSPFSPTMIPSRPGEVTMTSAMLRWEPPRNMIEDSYQVYKLEFGKAVTNEILTTLVQFSGTSLEITGLDLDTLYFARVQVVNTYAASEFSEDLVIHTKSDQTELDHFRDEVIADLEKIVEESHKKSSFCVSQDSSNTAGTLAYDQVDVQVNNVAGAHMDTETGLFTAGSGGYYQVTMSMEMTGGSGERHAVWFFHNGAKIEDSQLAWDYNPNMYGTGVENGSRDLVIQMQVGDTLGIFHETSSSKDLVNIVFCVNSVKLEMD